MRGTIKHSDPHEFVGAIHFGAVSLTTIAEQSAEHFPQPTFEHASEATSLSSGNVRDVVGDASVVVAIEDRREPADAGDLTLDMLLLLLEDLSRGRVRALRIASTRKTCHHNRSENHEHLAGALQVDAARFGNALLDGRLMLAEDVAEYAAGVERVRVGDRLLRCIQHGRIAVIAREGLVERGASVGRGRITREAGDHERKRDGYGLGRGALIGAELLADLLERVAA